MIETKKLTPIEIMIKKKIRRRLSSKGLSGVLKARSKFRNMFKTMKGIVKLKHLTAKKFDTSASLHTALKEALLSVLVNVGLEKKNCRVKLESAEDCGGSKPKISVRYRFR